MHDISVNNTIRIRASTTSPCCNTKQTGLVSFCIDGGKEIIWDCTYHVEDECREGKTRWLSSFISFLSFVPFYIYVARTKTQNMPHGLTLEVIMSGELFDGAVGYKNK